jgi:ATP-dependent RNA helicase RhlB
MLFSATLSYDVMELAYMFMNDAVKVSASPEQVTAEKVEHLVYHVGKDEKLPVLVGLLRHAPDARVLVFVNMKRTAERLERYLAANGLAAAAITGDVDQRRRLRLLADFKTGALPILIATDVASRGLHIEGVTHVINYDLPFDAEDYVHRVGRTARAGASGKAISLACEEYVEGLEAIERYIGFKLPFEMPHDDMLAPIHHPPREPRRAHGGPRHGRGAPAHGPRRDRTHAPRSERPAEHAPPAPPAPAAGADAPRRRRRSRRRRGPGGGAPASGPTSR